MSYDTLKVTDHQVFDQARETLKENLLRLFRIFIHINLLDGDEVIELGLIKIPYSPANKTYFGNISICPEKFP
jgi:hypothetical protein